MKIERKSLKNRLIKEIRIIKDSGSKIQLELENEALIEKNDNLKKMIKEDF